MTVTMADSIYPQNLPPGYGAYAGYVDGRWPDYQAIAARNPAGGLLSIAVTSADNADCLDVEPGDATNTTAPAWTARQLARGLAKPCLYTSISNAQALLSSLAANGISRSWVRLWSAHYDWKTTNSADGSNAHICGPFSCAYFGVSTPACDGTQWTSSAPGLGGAQIDASVLNDGFFGTTPPPVTTGSGVAAWQEAMVQQLPVLAENSANAGGVRTVQGLCCARGHSLTIDGSFGPLTKAAVEAVQSAARIGVDGIVGQQTWPVLMGV